MKELYKTNLLSRRHKELGYCQEGDFSTIRLLEVTEEEAPLICNIKDYDLNQNLRLYNKNYYSDWDKWNNKFIFKEKQGRLTERTAIILMVKLREEKEKNTNFYPASYSEEFILIGKRIYKKYCKKSELFITQCGNMLFSSWWSVDIETANENKKCVHFNKENFEKELKEAKEHYDKYKSKTRGDGHNYFSYPKIKWFREELLK
jgi:hypothetical protein